MKRTGTCPPPSVLETFATGACTDEAVGAHVDGCEVCRAAVEEIREEQPVPGRRADCPGGVGSRQARQPRKPGAGRSTPHRSNPSWSAATRSRTELHRGGQGVVYRAVQTRTRRTVAIKMLLGWHGATAARRNASSARSASPRGCATPTS